jgi:hypothetical protein
MFMIYPPMSMEDEAAAANALKPIRAPPYVPDFPADAEANDDEIITFVEKLFNLYSTVRTEEDKTFVLVKILRTYLALKDTLLELPEQRFQIMQFIELVKRRICVYNTVKDPDGILRRLLFRLREMILRMEDGAT